MMRRLRLLKGRAPKSVFALFGAGMILLAAVLIVYQNLTTLSGVVMADGLPAAGVLVRIQGTAAFTLTDNQGRFALVVPLFSEPFHITASAPGYFITVAAGLPTERISLNLTPHMTDDNPDYAFISPVLDREAESACARCHAARLSALESDSLLPVDEWLADAHSQSAVNPRFLSLYNGTTLDGVRGELTSYQFDPVAGVEVPVAPSLGQSGVGAGFRLDFPNSAGSCASCHAPVLALEEGYNGDPNTASGVSGEGVTCDFCHKISGVRLGADGQPLQGLPGVQSLVFTRPVEGEQIFFGPFDDTPGDDVYLPLQNQSAFCAACHSGSFWGVSVYNSFGEWLASPYSDPETGQTCQDCHMPRRGTTTFVDLPPDVRQFVPIRDPATIFSHRMPGAADSTLLANAASLTLSGERDSGVMRVSVQVTNTGTGHDLPTDNPLRNMILLVEALDADGAMLPLVDGPTIPDWGGIGDPALGYYAGLPGVLYAKILADAYTGEMPTAAYWRPVRLISDNRIAALETDTSTYIFDTTSAQGEVTVSTRLILRRAFIDLMVQKGWDTPDQLMAQETIVLP